MPIIGITGELPVLVAVPVSAKAWAMIPARARHRALEEPSNSRVPSAPDGSGVDEYRAIGAAEGKCTGRLSLPACG